VLCCKFQCFATNLRWIETQFALIFKILLLMLALKNEYMTIYFELYTPHIYNKLKKRCKKIFKWEKSLRISNVIWTDGAEYQCKIGHGDVRKLCRRLEYIATIVSGTIPLLVRSAKIKNMVDSLFSLENNSLTLLIFF
jgi:hypothetical protein